MVPVRDEAWILDLFLQAASLWADHIVVSDQASTDTSREIAARYPKVRLVSYPTTVFNETEHRTRLVAEARRIPGPKVLVGIDADELLSASVLTSTEWQAALAAPEGTLIEIAYHNLRPGFRQSWTVRHIALAVVDDGAPYRHHAIFHSPRVPCPDGCGTVTVGDVQLLHYQYTDWARMRSKHRGYIAFERVHEPGTSGVSIYRQYHHMDSMPPSALRDVDPEWFAGYQRLGVDATNAGHESTYRWDREILDLFDQIGTQHFAPCAIWDVDWTEIGRALGRPRPERYADPRTMAQRLVHRWLDLSQAQVHRRIFRAPDRVLRWLGW